MIGETPAVAILLASAVVLPVYGAFIARRRRRITVPAPANGTNAREVTTQAG